LPTETLAASVTALRASEMQLNEAHFSDWQPNTSQFARRKAFGKPRVALMISEATG